MVGAVDIMDGLYETFLENCKKMGNGTIKIEKVCMPKWYVLKDSYSTLLSMT